MKGRGWMGLETWRAAVGVSVAAVLAAGCSTPGWQLQGGEASAWYVEPQPGRAPEAVPETDYQPVFHEITPALISQHRARDPAAARARAALAALPELPADNGQYHVGKGDLLSVIVFGHPDITNPAGTTESVESSGRLVDGEGEIFVPFIGDMQVAGQTTDQIREKIAAGLRAVINTPQVDVKVLRFRSQEVFITGDLPRPCQVPIRDLGLTVVEALNQCDALGLNRQSDEQAVGVNAVKLVRAGETYALNLSALYRGGGGPVELRSGDRLIVDDSVNRIFVVGEFSEQRAVPYSAGGVKLADAIAAAGGLDLETADASGIYVIRGLVDARSGPESGLETRPRPHVYHLDASSVDAMILADRFRLRPRDVVFAAPASLVNFNRALNQVTPSLDVLLRSSLLFTR